ncbi:50S ribosomal protein L4 [Candidatus Woesearchaeota archaeon]|nr:50S ribosomal protein L4 [Candidatus Woesearchaeota archaeon]
MTKLKVIGKDGEKGSIDLPKQFEEPIRKDLIKRAVLSAQSNQRQPHGTNPLAGKRPSAKLSRRRRECRGSYGKGISRVPRKILNRRGSQMYMVGAFAPGTVGGRRAHPPKAEKILIRKINDKERKKAIRSALHATTLKELVQERGHKVPKNYPFVIDDSFEKINKTSELVELLEKLGLTEELERTKEKKVRSGKGKVRGNPYKKKKGPLFVVSQKCELQRAAENLPGVDAVSVESLNAELLAPGTHVGRLTLYTQSAIKKLEKESLFM